MLQFVNDDLHIFTNLAKWKFPYQNRLVEISRESYDNLVYVCILSRQTKAFHIPPITSHHVLLGLHKAVLSAVKNLLNGHCERTFQRRQQASRHILRHKLRAV